VISHGAGGSENGYRFIVQDLAARGYTAIVMGHRESGVAALRTQILRRGLRPGVRALVVDPVAERARLLDVDATLVWANAKCTPPFRVLLGHSMGAESVMLEAGVRNMIDLPSPPAGQDRFDAYVALSPEGPGLVFPEHAWSDIDKPMLTITGTRDESLAGGPEARQIPWRELPGNRAKCQWLGVIDGATHMNLAGIGSGAKRVEDRVLRTIASFLTGVRRSACEIPAPEEGVTLSTK
jgi:predicted dienelactone hydrolase